MFDIGITLLKAPTITRRCFFNKQQNKYPTKTICVFVSYNRKKHIFAVGRKKHLYENKKSSYSWLYYCFFLNRHDCPSPALTMHNGQEVVNKEQWEAERRPEIIKLFQDNEYGILPETTINSNYRIVEESDNALGGRAIRRQVEITFSSKGQSRKMLVLIYMPKGVKKCPVFVSPNFQGNATTTTDPYVIESQFSTYGRANQTSRWPYAGIPLEDVILGRL